MVKIKKRHLSQTWEEFNSDRKKRDENNVNTVLGTTKIKLTSKSGVFDQILIESECKYDGKLKRNQMNSGE